MSKERDIAYGRHSLIPECCITYFVNAWEYERRLDTPYSRDVHNSSYNYVPCPECFAKKRKAKIRLCINGCGRQCWKDY
jgi:hypothetical protein